MAWTCRHNAGRWRIGLLSRQPKIKPSWTRENTLKKILIIEDERSLREALADILTIKNFLPFSAKNGKEGVEIAAKEHPDLILLDLIMPEMDGTIALR